MMVVAVYLLLALAVIFGAAYVICYIPATYAPQVPGQVQSFIRWAVNVYRIAWLVAAIIAIIKVVQWARLV